METVTPREGFSNDLMHSVMMTMHGELDMPPAQLQRQREDCCIENIVLECAIFSLSVNVNKKFPTHVRRVFLAFLHNDDYRCEYVTLE